MSDDKYAKLFEYKSPTAATARKSSSRPPSTIVEGDRKSETFTPDETFTSGDPSSSVRGGSSSSSSSSGSTGSSFGNSGSSYSFGGAEGGFPSGHDYGGTGGSRSSGSQSFGSVGFTSDGFADDDPGVGDQDRSASYDGDRFSSGPGVGRAPSGEMFGDFSTGDDANRTAGDARGPTAGDHDRGGTGVILAAAGIGLGLGAAIAMRGGGGAVGSKVSAKFGSAFSGISSMRKMFNYKQMEGFESVMSKAEAAKILNVSQHRVDLNRIAKCHRELLMRNHPDRGGSTFIASKINEAKEVITGKRRQM